MSPNNLIHKMIQFYEKRHEEERLEIGIGPIERWRTKELISSFIDKPSLHIADVGGGIGEYGLWLASGGHRVDLFDLMARHIQIAKRRNQRAQRKMERIEKADARKLNVDSGTYDLVVLHGPLYHFPSKKDRLMSLKEARRILKDDGVLLSFGISYTASTIVGLHSGMIFEDNYLKMVTSEIETGLHLPPSNFPFLFVDGHFHRPRELETEIKEAGLIPRYSLAVEGSSWLVPDFHESWKDPEKRSVMLKVTRLLEKDCYNSPHFMVASTKLPERLLRRKLIQKSVKS
ncbi:MAG: class I SAM-dependent methyltransferase [Desulfobacteraceae bacterium]|mgnify:CR=1 FL=1|nr:MAG: class I SAM-dependent methyltransferase [Desulfobacteraceae bacterium]